MIINEEDVSITQSPKKQNTPSTTNTYNVNPTKTVSIIKNETKTITAPKTKINIKKRSMTPINEVINRL